MSFKKADIEIREEKVDLACQGCRTLIGHIIQPIGTTQSIYICKDCHDRRRQAGVSPREDFLVRHVILCDCGCKTLIAYADYPESHPINATNATVGHLTEHAPKPDKFDLVGDAFRKAKAEEIGEALRIGKITPVQAVMEILKLVG